MPYFLGKESVRVLFGQKSRRAPELNARLAAGLEDTAAVLLSRLTEISTPAVTKPDEIVGRAEPRARTTLGGGVCEWPDK